MVEAIADICYSISKGIPEGYVNMLIYSRVKDGNSYSIKEIPSTTSTTRGVPLDIDQYKSRYREIGGIGCLPPTLYHLYHSIQLPPTRSIRPLKRSGAGEERAERVTYCCSIDSCARVGWGCGSGGGVGCAREISACFLI